MSASEWVYGPDEELFDASEFDVEIAPRPKPARRRSSRRSSRNATGESPAEKLTIGAANCTHALGSRWPDIASVPPAWRSRWRCAFCGHLMDDDPHAAISRPVDGTPDADDRPKGSTMADRDTATILGDLIRAAIDDTNLGLARSDEHRLIARAAGFATAWQVHLRIGAGERPDVVWTNAAADVAKVIALPGAVDSALVHSDPDNRVPGRGRQPPTEPPTSEESTR